MANAAGLAVLTGGGKRPFRPARLGTVFPDHATGLVRQGAAPRPPRIRLEKF